ncbi:MAG: YggS family pyridoxal phosphate-dependent enzyme [Bdellovibrionales bacterium]
MSVETNLQTIEKRIGLACEKASRPREAVRLLAVAKGQSIAKVQAAYWAGQVDIAENYVQEALVKREQLENLSIRWHFIGRIQTNKVKLLADRFYLIHSIDRLRVAEILNAVTTRPPQRILLQFNVAEENTKAGVPETELEGLLMRTLELPNLSVCGLMIMPPAVEGAEEVRPYFAKAKSKLMQLRERLSSEQLARHPLDQLSMGTTQDYTVAIEEGATWVRIGTDVFGSREEKE